MYEIRRNALAQEVLMPIISFLRGGDCNWYFRNTMTRGNEEDIDEFLSHNFFFNHDRGSPAFDLIKPIISVLDAKALYSVRANLQIHKERHKHSMWHTDNEFKNCKTAIFYVNTCNGYTELKDDDKIIKVDSEENKLLIFDSYHEHRAVSQTDTKQRIVINFNYF